MEDSNIIYLNQWEDRQADISEEEAKAYAKALLAKILDKADEISQTHRVEAINFYYSDKNEDVTHILECFALCSADNIQKAERTMVLAIREYAGYLVGLNGWASVDDIALSAGVDLD